MIAGVVLALSAMVAWPALVPVLPVRTYTASFYPAIDSDQPETIGWPELVGTARVGARHPAGRAAPDGRGVHGQLRGGGGTGVVRPGRPVYSGHNGWADWGPPPEGAGPSW